MKLYICNKLILPPCPFLSSSVLWLGYHSYISMKGKHKFNSSFTHWSHLTNEHQTWWTYVTRQRLQDTKSLIALGATLFSKSGKTEVHFRPQPLLVLCAQLTRFTGKGWWKQLLFPNSIEQKPILSQRTNLRSPSRNCLQDVDN